MTTDDDLINDPDAKIDKSLIKLAEQYAACDRKSAELNEERKTIRDNAEKLGIPSKSFQHAVGMVKHMSEGERRDYQVGVNRVLKAISDRQGDLFPAEAERIRKRVEREEQNAAPTPGPDPDTNPRSDPNRGGAKPQVGDEKPWPDDAVAAATGTVKPTESPNPPGEQEAGAAVLSVVEKIGKKSQSQAAKEKRAAAGLN